MKYVNTVILLLFSVFSFSQTQAADPVKKLSGAGTVIFVADNSGCFGGEVTEYKLIKLKNGERKVMFKKEGKENIKKLSAKNYAAFVKRFSVSYDKFKDPDAVKQTCTSVSLFTLKNNKNSLEFKNVTCEGEFNPEFLLQELMK